MEEELAIFALSGANRAPVDGLPAGRRLSLRLVGCAFLSLCFESLGHYLSVVGDVFPD